MKRFGFGCMRLPLKDGQIDMAEFTRMVDTFMEAGYTYFDTAHPYMKGLSEGALKKALTERYPRESFLLADKLSTHYFNTEEEIRPFFEEQLALCGVEYFDYYLMHAQTAVLYEKFRQCKAYEQALTLKTEGRIRHFGISFHDTPEVLRQILTEYPQIEFVQLQFNYLDYNDSAVQSRKCYELCCEYGKPVFVMKPVKGGVLSDLNDDCLQKLRVVTDQSASVFALRFASGFDNVKMVLSGMSTLEQMRENIAFMNDPVPFSDAEYSVAGDIAEAIRQKGYIRCTGCRYCVDGCPAHILIPDIFACYNGQKRSPGWSNQYYYSVMVSHGGKASDCIGCGQCENSCPQHLEIRSHLKEVASEFD